MLELHAFAGTGVGIASVVLVIGDAGILTGLVRQEALVPDRPGVSADGLAVVLDDEMDGQVVVLAVLDAFVATPVSEVNAGGLCCSCAAIIEMA